MNKQLSLVLVLTIILAFHAVPGEAIFGALLALARGFLGRRLLDHESGPTGLILVDLTPEGASYNVTITGWTTGYGNLTFSHLHMANKESNDVAYFCDEGDEGFDAPTDGSTFLLTSGFIPIDDLEGMSNTTTMKKLQDLFTRGLFLGDVHTTMYKPPTEFMRAKFVQMD
ncbi:hypothetical protein WJX73_003951 [Symbiochloris irregularis]|uniref:CHRD domain-containing protein n=1 Tax=Symbiochloris irregularis TaxID=706552 RepID=A0AAW1NR78_9CHLO